MAFPENITRGGTSTFAEEGTAAHTLAGWCLGQQRDADSYIGTGITNESGMKFMVDDDMARHVQTYVDDVRRRALGGHLLIEQHVDISEILGPDGGGTSDAVILEVPQEMLTSEDLKFGQGEVVYASYLLNDGVTRRINHQLGLYLIGAKKDAEMIFEPKHFRGVISQPRVGHLDEHTITAEELEDFGRKMQLAREQGEKCIKTPVPLDAESNPPELEPYLNPGEKTCRWCSAQHRCTKLKRYIETATRSDFDTISAVEPVPPTENLEMLSKAIVALPLIEAWCRAIRGALDRHVRDGKKVMGPDGQPYKMVEGKLGNRGWSSKAEAEEALLGQLSPDKVYEPQEIITAAAAKKILDKKATKKIWQEIFEPIDEKTKQSLNTGLVRRSPGQPIIVLGSDPRPPYVGAATTEDFNEIHPEAE